MKEKLENALFITTAILSIGISVADFLGLLDSLPFLSERIPALTLLMVGILTSCLVLFSQRILNLQKNSSQMNMLFKVFKDDDHFSEIVLLYSFRMYSKLISDNKILVGRDHALKFWRDCLGGSKQWYALDYTPNKDSRESYWGNAMSEGIQLERIKTGSVIRRVFVIDTDIQLEFLRGVMKNQKDNNIEVRWVYKCDLLRNSDVANYIADLHTLDFAIVDNSWVYKGSGDLSNGPNAYVAAVKDNDMLYKAKRIFNEAFIMGKPLES
jgi:hypothetical protein